MHVKKVCILITVSYNHISPFVQFFDLINMFSCFCYICSNKNNHLFWNVVATSKWLMQTKPNSKFQCSLLSVTVRYKESYFPVSSPTQAAPDSTSVLGWLLPFIQLLRIVKEYPRCSLFLFCFFGCPCQGKQILFCLAQQVFDHLSWDFTLSANLSTKAKMWTKGVTLYIIQLCVIAWKGRSDCRAYFPSFKLKRRRYKSRCSDVLNNFSNVRVLEQQGRLEIEARKGIMAFRMEYVPRRDSQC